MQQPAENFLHPVVGPLLSAVPSKEVLRRRKTERIEACWLFVMWAALAVMALAIIGGLIFGGWSAILKLFTIAHPPFEEVVVFLLCVGGLVIYLGYSMWKGVDELFRIGAFRKLYRVCLYIEPMQLAHYRLSHLMLQRPSRFTYAFSGTKLVVRIQKVTTQDSPQSPFVITVTEEKENATDESTDAEQERGAPVAEPIIVESVLISAAPETGLLQAREEGISGVQDHKASVAVPKRKLSLLIDIHQSVSLVLVEETSEDSPTGTRKAEEEVPLRGNLHYEAIVARLAVRGKEGVERTRLMRDIYGSTTEDHKQMEQSFYDDMRRIRGQVKKCVEKSFPGMAPSADQLKLFESGKKIWFLSESCQVRGRKTLNAWYRRIKAMQQGTDTRTLSEGELVKLASLLIEDYSQRYLDTYADEEGYTGGYLLQKLHENPFASWAPGFFVECRNQFVFVMTFIAECMFRMGILRKREDFYYEKAARYYKECAYAATCAPADQDQGEKALRSCIDMYMGKQDIDSAQEVLRVYAKRMGRIMSGWEPTDVTRKMITRYNLMYD